MIFVLLPYSASKTLNNTYNSEIISGGKNSRYGYEGKEYDSLTDYIDFKFRKYESDIIIYDKPDTLIPNVYDPQSLNRYSFERNNPIASTDEDGHCGLYCAAAVIGFAIGTISYGYNHRGEGRGSVGNFVSYMGKGIAQGFVGAATAVGTVAFATYGGRAAAGAGTVGLLTGTGKFLVGSTGELTSEILEGEELDSYDIVAAGATNTLIPGFRLTPGTKVSTTNFFTKNNLKLAGQIFNSFLAFATYSGVRTSFFIQANQQQLYQQYQESVRQDIINKAKSGEYSGDAGYNADAGAYVTEGGLVYPTNNPEWEPCGCSIN